MKYVRSGKLVMIYKQGFDVTSTHVKKSNLQLFSKRDGDMTRDAALT